MSTVSFDGFGTTHGPGKRIHGIAWMRERWACNREGSASKANRNFGIVNEQANHFR